MNKKKSKNPSWIDVKKSIGSSEHSQLIDLVKDLYKLSEENKNFLPARCLAGDDPIKRYKKIILHALYPDVMAEKDEFDFDRADKAIVDYMKATSDDEGTADLMIHYVECGDKFILDYGDIEDFFYDALIEMYEKAIEKGPLPAESPEGNSARQTDPHRCFDKLGSPGDTLFGPQKHAGCFGMKSNW